MRFAVLLALITVCALADDPKPGAIEGRVIDAKSGDPVKKAVVTLRQGEQPASGVYTDANGRFAFPDLAPGAYLVSGERDGFVTDEGSEHIAVTVEPGKTAQTVDVKLLRTGAVSGRITDPDGDPVVGANVELLPAHSSKGTFQPGNSTSTNDRGEYRAFHLKPGKYRIQVSYTPRIQRAQFRVDPKPGQSAAATEENYGATYYPGTLNPAEAAAIEVSPSSELSGFDVQLRRARGVGVRGTVSIASGAPPALTMVSMHSIGGPGLSWATNLQPPSRAFEIRNVPPGRYAVLAVATLGQSQLIATRAIEIEAGDIEGVELVLSAPQKISGKVAVPEGRKLSEGLIVALASRERPGTDSGGGMGDVQPDGSFAMGDVAPGDYDVILASTADGPGDDLYVASIRMGDRDVLAEGVHVGAAEPAPLELKLKPNGGQIDFVVADADQKPAPDAQVELLPDPPRQTQPALFGQCRTDAAGKCSMLGIAPGEYHALAFAKESDIDFRDPAAWKGLEPHSKAIRIGEGDRQTTELRAIPEER